jgi:hypothetical protein
MQRFALTESRQRQTRRVRMRTELPRETETIAPAG